MTHSKLFKGCALEEGIEARKVKEDFHCYIVKEERS